MRKLLDLLKRFPSLAEVPAVVRGGRVYTLGELARLASEGVEWAREAIARLGMDPSPEELRRLAAEFWRRLPRDAVLVVMGAVPAILSGEEAAKAIERGEPVSQLLVDIYVTLLREVARLAA